MGEPIWLELRPQQHVLPWGRNRTGKNVRNRFSFEGHHEGRAGSSGRNRSRPGQGVYDRLDSCKDRIRRANTVRGSAAVCGGHNPGLSYVRTGSHWSLKAELKPVTLNGLECCRELVDIKPVDGSLVRIFV